MKLTPIQIERLYKFTREHFVEYYDLQTELVDHLANGIEKRWEENPKLSFDDALHLEFKEFGILGFNDVIEKHNAILSKKYYKIIFRFIREYIKLPKIIGIICAILAVFYIIRHVESGFWIIISGYIALLLYIVYKTISIRSKYEERKEITGKRWKLEEIISLTGDATFTSFNILNIGLIMDFTFTHHYLVQVLIAILLVVLALLTYIVGVIIPEKAEELLRETYPEYELSE